MLFDFEYKKGNLILSEVDPNGNLQFSYYPWKFPKKYEVCDDNDTEKSLKYTTWNRKSVKLVPTSYPDRFSIYEYLDALPVEEKERIYKLQYPKVFMIDIETEILPTGFVEPTDATSKILNIAIVRDRNVWVLGIKPLTQKEINEIKDDIEKHFAKFDLKIKFEYKTFHDSVRPEYDMMYHFVNYLLPKMPVISGWNVLDYDWTFIINRLRVLGINPDNTSLTKRLEEIYGTPYEVPAHKVIIDYMILWKKPWNGFCKIQESNALDWVGETLLGVQKIHYDGSLQDLYDHDYKKYVFYNAVDTILVQLIHEKTKLLDIMTTSTALSKIRMCDVSYKNTNITLVGTEGHLRQPYRDSGVVLCKNVIDKSEDATTIEGGYVKVPLKGLWKWIATLDFSSMYPTNSITFNLAPEKYKGVVIALAKLFQDFEDFKITSHDYYKKRKEIIQYIRNKKSYPKSNIPMEYADDDIICVNGCVMAAGDSVTVNFFKRLFASRKGDKKTMNLYKGKLEIAEQELKELERKLAMKS